MHHEGNESELYETNRLVSGSPALNRTLPEAEPDPLNSTEAAARLAPPSHTELPEYTPVPVPVLSLFTFCSLVSLIPVVVFIGRRKLRRRPMFQMLSNLAVSEHLMSSMTLVVLSLRHWDWKLSKAACSTLMGVRSGLLLAEASALLCISVERHLAVIHGLRYFTLLAGFRRKLLLAAPWLVVAVSTATTAVATFPYLRGPTSRCLYMMVVPVGIRLAVNCITIAIFLVIIILHEKIRRVAVRHSRQIARQRMSVGLSAEGVERMASYWGIFKAIGLNIAVTVPLCLLYICESAGLDVPKLLLDLFGVVSLLRSTLNGWIFGYWNDEVRGEYSCIRARSEDPDRTKKVTDNVAKSVHAQSSLRARPPAPATAGELPKKSQGAGASLQPSSPMPSSTDNIDGIIHTLPVPESPNDALQLTATRLIAWRASSTSPKRANAATISSEPDSGLRAALPADCTAVGSLGEPSDAQARSQDTISGGARLSKAPAFRRERVPISARKGASMGAENGGTGDASPAVEKSVGDVSPEI